MLFSDIEASTQLNERLGDVRWLELLRAHHAIVREQVHQHGGFEVKSQGDGFMIAFPSARRAVQCARAIQQAIESHLGEHPDAPIRLRIGLHTGEAIKEEADFYGKNIVLAARIADEAARRRDPRVLRRQTADRERRRPPLRERARAGARRARRDPYGLQGHLGRPPGGFDESIRGGVQPPDAAHAGRNGPRLFLFVLLFGLSMDYHVFILSRIREAFDGGMTTGDAVAHGIKSTAGVVTSAAAVMIAVFSVFATLSALDMKQMGVGLAVAVLIDATLVRAVLLPATMKLLGDWNWYLPSWLGWMPDAGREPEPEGAAA